MPRRAGRSGAPPLAKRLAEPHLTTQSAAFIFYSGLEQAELKQLVEETGALGQLAAAPEALLRQVRPREGDAAAWPGLPAAGDGLDKCS
jgi:hypothetical protein